MTNKKELNIINTLFSNKIKLQEVRKIKKKIYITTISFEIMLELVRT